MIYLYFLLQEKNDYSETFISLNGSTPESNEKRLEIMQFSVTIYGKHYFATVKYTRK